MKSKRRLNKAGKIALLILILVIILIIIFLYFIKYQKKHEIHILKTGKNYQLKINYPLLHNKKIDKKIKEYVNVQKEQFLEAVSKINNEEVKSKYELVIQYQMNQDDNVYHIRLETFSYIGGENYTIDDETFHYDIKNKKFLTINDYLKDSNSLEKLSALAYYYIMKYGEENGKTFNEEIIKEKITLEEETFIHFNLKTNGFEILFPYSEVSTWSDGEIKILIPYKEINELLKEQYQKPIIKENEKKITPEKRNLEKYKNKKLIAFTFDDGPSLTTTSLLLDEVKKYDAKVTFFVLGNRVEQNKSVLQRAYREGHAIGSHTYNHRNLLLLSDYARMQEIKNTNDVIESVIGIKPTLLRTPYGNVNDDIKKISNMHIIEWNIDTLDWKNKDKNIIAEEIINKAHDGAIVLLHDIYPTSVEGAILAMEKLEQEGYAFVTIPEMAKLKNIELDYTTSYYSLSK